MRAFQLRRTRRKHKTPYSVTNRSGYARSLRERLSLPLWNGRDATGSWCGNGRGRPVGVKDCSDAAIGTWRILGVLYRRPPTQGARRRLRGDGSAGFEPGGDSEAPIDYEGECCGRAYFLGFTSDITGPVGSFSASLGPHYIISSTEEHGDFSSKGIQLRLTLSSYAFMPALGVRRDDAGGAVTIRKS